MTELEILRKINKEHKQLLKDYFKLQDAAKTLYLSAHWISDRLTPDVEALMWENLKEASNIVEPGPKRIK